MKNIVMLLVTVVFSAAHAMDIPQMDSSAKQAAIKGAIHAYAKSVNMGDAETGCKGSVLNINSTSDREGIARVLVSDCRGFFAGEARMYRVGLTLNLSAPGGVYVVRSASPFSAPDAALR